jgi:hypothetical protein
MKYPALLTKSLLSLLLLCISVAAQTTPCPLKTNDLPELLGFKLGMTIPQLKQRYPKLFEEYNFDPDTNGYLELDLTGFYDSRLSKFMNETERKGLDGLKLAFLDDKLVKMRIVYDGFTEWDSVDEFLNSIAKNLKLPVTGWKNTSDKTRQLDCSGASLEVRLDPKLGQYELQKPSITFVEQGIDDVLKERERTKKDRQRREFKP